MKRILSLVLFVAFAATAHATTWYIRADGGTLGQCTGQTDAPYSATVVAKACGLNDYRLLAFPGAGGYVTTGTWKVQGGDTIRIHAGQYRVGYNGPNPADHDGLEIAGNPFASAMPSIPSGTAANPTRIIGDGSATTQLYGGYGAGNVISLSGSSFVQISGLELTDHGQCTRVGVSYTAPVVACYPGYPLSDYAAIGIYTNASTHDITLTDLNIHGFTSDGIKGAIGGLITVSHVRLGFNASAGWDFDDGSGTQSINGSVVADHLTIEGSGCNEEYPIVHTGFPAFSCFDQSSAGYGDGVGTPGTPLNFTCDYCTFRYNTQDGLDLLHTHGSIIRVTNSQSYGNMGQQWKMGAMKQVVFQNNITNHNCQRMKYPIAGNTAYSLYLSNFCRAAGDGIALAINDDSQYTWTNNSYAGYGATSYDISCSGACTKPVITYENNLNIGYTASGLAGSQTPGIFYYTMTYNPFVANDHNIFYQMRTCPTTGGVCTNPMIANEPTDAQVTSDETVLDNLDFHLTTASANAIQQGTAGADIGAFTSAMVAPPIGGSGTPGDGTTITPPPSPTPTAFDIVINLTCTPTGTAYNCASK